ncbi:hypothetical protein FB451DRAFT_1371677 [Mycena latifolia]|nr:hypothetical protein FB451DRAFT_1371677 [Mycena latifolia]
MNPAIVLADSDSEWEEHFAHLIITNAPPSDSEAVEILEIIDSNRKAIARLTSDIEPLAARRDELRRITQSLALLLSTKPRRTLPFDVVAEIFRTVVDVVPDPWILGQICKRWRAIALECPELWTSIDIDHAASNPRMRPTGYPFEKLQTLLNRSLHQPLTIRFCTVARCLDAPPVSFDADRLFGALVACSSRWGSLSLRCTPQIFPLLAQVKGKLPLLHTLSLDMCFDRILLDAFETAPRLRSLACLTGWRLTPLMLMPWSQITRYIGDFGLWDDHITALEQLVNVEECRLTLTNWAENENTEILDLPKLRRLYVARGNLLEFTAPRLEELVIEPLDMTPPPDALGNLTSLVQRSACQLTKLCFIAAIPDMPAVSQLVSVLQLLPSLVELCVQSRRLNELIELSVLVAALHPTAPCLLPRLEALTFGGYGVPDGAALVDMVAARCHASPAVCSALRAFSLLYHQRLYPIHPADLAQLDTLRSVAGLDLTVIIGPGAREAMVNVPFYYAGLSDGTYWAPDNR